MGILYLWGGVYVVNYEITKKYTKSIADRPHYTLSSVDIIDIRIKVIEGKIVKTPYILPINFPIIQFTKNKIKSRITIVAPTGVEQRIESTIPKKAPITERTAA